MSIKTRSSFYYVDAITPNNRYISFDEGGGEIVGLVDIGSYAMDDLASAVSRALNAFGDNDYTVTFNRITRKIQISSSLNFTLLASSGSTNSVSIYPLLGFTLDQSGSNSYSSDDVAGYEYRPQFYLQNYIDFEEDQERVNEVINESASGLIESVSFGNRKFASFNIAPITNVNFGANTKYRATPIETNLSGLDDAIAFLKHATTKGYFEFNKDRDNPNLNYHRVVLESTERSQSGTGFRINRFNNADEYYQTGTLKLRKT